MNTDPNPDAVAPTLEERAAERIELPGGLIAESREHPCRWIIVNSEGYPRGLLTMDAPDVRALASQAAPGVPAGVVDAGRAVVRAAKSAGPLSGGLGTARIPHALLRTLDAALSHDAQADLSDAVVRLRSAFALPDHMTDGACVAYAVDHEIDRERILAAAQRAVSDHQVRAGQIGRERDGALALLADLAVHAVVSEGQIRQAAHLEHDEVRKLVQEAEKRSGRIAAAGQAPTPAVDLPGVEATAEGRAAVLWLMPFLDALETACDAYAERNRYGDAGSDLAEEAGHIGSINDARLALVDEVCARLVAAGTGDAGRDHSGSVAEKVAPAPAAAQSPAAGVDLRGASFQARVKPWVVACFGDEVACDELERMDRFVEEVFEAVQSRGCGRMWSG